MHLRKPWIDDYGVGFVPTATFYGNFLNNRTLTAGLHRVMMDGRHKQFQQHPWALKPSLATQFLATKWCCSSTKKYLLLSRCSISSRSCLVAQSFHTWLLSSCVCDASEPCIFGCMFDFIVLSVIRSCSRKAVHSNRRCCTWHFLKLN